jgi:hypothetical protein
MLQILQETFPKGKGSLAATPQNGETSLHQPTHEEKALARYRLKIMLSEISHTTILLNTGSNACAESTR